MSKTTPMKARINEKEKTITNLAQNLKQKIEEVIKLEETNKELKVKLKLGQVWFPIRIVMNKLVINRMRLKFQVEWLKNNFRI